MFRLCEVRPTPAQLYSPLWGVIQTLEEHLDSVAGGEDVDTAELCKLAHALAQSAGPYMRAIEVGELEARMAALEKQVEAQR